MTCVIFCGVGCGDNVSSSIPSAVEKPAVMPQTVLTQKVVTDEHGTRTITVPVPVYSGEPIKGLTGERAPRPKAKVEPLTMESVGADLDQAIREMKEVLTKHGGDARVREICRPLVYRLSDVSERLQKPDCNLAHEQAEIREIREALRRQIPERPLRKTLPPPKEKKEF